jgi:hypothetical protein
VDAELQLEPELQILVEPELLRDAALADMFDLTRSHTICFILVRFITGTGVIILPQFYLKKRSCNF